MNENLNLVDLLKDCPKGTKFYSSLYGDVYFDYIEPSSQCPHPVILNTSGCGNVEVTSDGRHYFHYNGECTLFPSKDQRDWSKWHLPFKDGDVITCTNSCCSFVAIFKETNTDITFRRYVSLILDDEQQLYTKEGWADFTKPRLATEEEKQLFFDVIRKKGYKWNQETKTLEKLIIPKFKVGDVIQDVNKYKVKITEVNVEDECYEYESIIAKGIGGIAFVEQNVWKLVPNKFDPNTLIPFESKVLVRDANHFSWVGSIFTHRKENRFYTVSGSYYYQCIPYNDDTAHLIGTHNEAPEYYRYWGE